MTFSDLVSGGVFGYLLNKTGYLAWWIIGFALCAIAGYLLGSINFGIIISKYKFHDDIRLHGSGNAGATNMMRTYGKAAAAFTFLGDGMKAVVSVLVGTALNGNQGAYVAALLCVIGHAYPVFYKFKGGKGVAVTAFALLMLNPFVFLVLLILFVAIVAFTKYISLGSIMCMLMYPLLLYRMSGNKLDAIVLFCALINSVFVIFCHRSNIKRLWAGTENKFSFHSKQSGKAAAEKAGAEITSAPDGAAAAQDADDKTTVRSDKSK